MLTRSTRDSRRRLTLVLHSDRSGFIDRIVIDRMIQPAPYLDVSGEVGSVRRSDVELVPLPTGWPALVAAIVALEGRAELDQSQELRGVIYDRLLR